MIGEITKILPIRNSRNYGDLYIRVTFKLEGRGWAKTDLVPGFRNYKRWRKLLKVGNILGNLKMKDEKTIDADSQPILITGEKSFLLKMPESLKEQARLGIYG